MPIYEFVCKNCNYEFEKIQSFSDTTVPTCANCGSDRVSRQLSPPAIHFKGSGWYVTDSKKAAKDSASRNGGDSAPETSGAADKADAPDANRETSGETRKETSSESKQESGSGKSGTGKSSADGSNAGGSTAGGAKTEARSEASGGSDG